MINKTNLYWPIYQNLEKEVLSLADKIYFDDNQLNVYSIKIADLIFRCATELESIAKDIYREETKQEPINSGVCFSWLEKNWKISKKQIIVASQYFYFKKEFNPSFAPFDYRKKKRDDYYGVYNAIKHDKVKNIKKANINILIRILGSLFILNIYYKNKKYHFENKEYKYKRYYTENEDFPANLGSDIFLVTNPCYIHFLINGTLSINSIDIDKCIYIKKSLDSTYTNIVNLYKKIKNPILINDKIEEEFEELYKKNGWSILPVEDTGEGSDEKKLYQYKKSLDGDLEIVLNKGLNIYSKT